MSSKVCIYFKGNFAVIVQELLLLNNKVSPKASCHCSEHQQHEWLVYTSVVLSLEHLVSVWDDVSRWLHLFRYGIRPNLTSVLRVRLSPLFIITGHHYLQILLTNAANVIILSRRVSQKVRYLLWPKVRTRKNGTEIWSRRLSVNLCILKKLAGYFTESLVSIYQITVRHILV